MNENWNDHAAVANWHLNCAIKLYLASTEVDQNEDDAYIEKWHMVFNNR